MTQETNPFEKWASPREFLDDLCNIADSGNTKKLANKIRTLREQYVEFEEYVKKRQKQVLDEKIETLTADIPNDNLPESPDVIDAKQEIEIESTPKKALSQMNKTELMRVAVQKGVNVDFGEHTKKQIIELIKQKDNQ